MKKIVLLFLLFGMLSQLSANAFGQGSFYDIYTSVPVFTEKPEKRSISIDINETISEINEKTQTIDSSVQKIFLSLVSKLSTQNDIQALKNKIDTISCDTAKTQTEQNTLINQVLCEYTNGLFANKDSVRLLAERLSDSEKKEIANDILALSKYSKEYLSLQKKELNIKDLLPNLKNKNEMNDLAAQLSYLSDLLINRSETTLSLANDLTQLLKIIGLN